MKQRGRIFVYRLNPVMKSFIFSAILIQGLLLIFILRYESHVALFTISTTLLLSVFTWRSYKISINEHGLHISRFLKSSLITWNDVEEIEEIKTIDGLISACVIKTPGGNYLLRKKYLEQFSFMLHQMQLFWKTCKNAGLKS